MAEVTDDVSRVLGRIEARLDQALDELAKLNAGLIEHQKMDAKSFSEVRELVFKQREELKEFIEVRLSAQNVKLDAMQKERDIMQGAGWVLVAIFGALATMFGSTIVNLVSNYLKR